MAWSELKLPVGTVFITPIKATESEFENCDSTGRVVKSKISRGTTEYYHTDDNTPAEKPDYKLINGTPKKKLKKTTTVTKVERIPKTEIYNYNEEGFYLVKSDDALAKELAEKDEALTFNYTNGNGFKVHKAFIYPFANTLVMRLSRVNISRRVSEIQAGLQAGKELEALETQMEQQSRATEEELLATLEI